MAANVELPRLAGILVSSHSKSAIFAADGDGRPVVVGVGGDVGGFRVQAIEPGQATVVGADGGTRLLRPSSGPRLPTAQAAAQATLPDRGTAVGAVTRPRPRPAVVTLSAPLAANAGPTRSGAPFPH